MVKMDVETFIVEHRGQNVSLESQITACSIELEFATGLFYLICCFDENVKQLADFKNIKSYKMGTL